MRAVKTVVSNINLKNGKQTESDKETAEELCRYFSEVFVKEEAWKGDEGGRTCSANLSRNALYNLHISCMGFKLLM